MEYVSTALVATLFIIVGYLLVSSNDQQPYIHHYRRQLIGVIFILPFSLVLVPFDLMTSGSVVLIVSVILGYFFRSKPDQVRVRSSERNPEKKKSETH
jgi:hypothetical protein